jgi:hypothetical protein
MERGLAVYCQKPLTQSVWEARLLTKAQQKYKVATQMGNQGFSHEGTKTTCEILWSGDIGDVKEVHAWTGGIYGGQPNIPATGPEAVPVPETLDWDLWLGPAPMRPYNSVLSPRGVHQHFPNWRNYREYSGGMMTDWGAHHNDIARWAIGLEGPTEVEAKVLAEPLLGTGDGQILPGLFRMNQFITMAIKSLPAQGLLNHPDLVQEFPKGLIFMGDQITHLFTVAIADGEVQGFLHSVNKSRLLCCLGECIFQLFYNPSGIPFGPETFINPGSQKISTRI